MEFTTLMLLILEIVFLSLVSVIKKIYNRDSQLLFTFFTCVFVLVFFLVVYFIKNGLSFSFDAGLLMYAIPFGACFTTTSLFSLKAVKEGDLALTGLFTSFALIIPTAYGVIFLKDPVGLFFYLGLALFFVCLVLVNLKTKKADEKRKPITLKWALYVFIAAATNGGGMLFQTMQQKAYGGQKGDELMIIALFIAVIVLIPILLISEKDKIKPDCKRAILVGAIAGLVTGGLNLLTMVFTGQNLIPVAIFFPLISGGSIILTFVIGWLCYKEKYTTLQYIGILVGVVSVVLLNL